MKYVYFLILSLIPLINSAQQRELIQGKIVAKPKSLEGIYVSNINTGQAILTRKGGYFGIKARPNDTLMFSSALFIGHSRVLDELDFKKELLFVPLEENGLITNLEEIVISKITAESLGIVPKGTKSLTPAERKLYTANSGNGLVPLDLIVNAITGKTKMLKKALKYESQEFRKDHLLDIFDIESIEKDYNIPKNHVIGFAYFSVSDDEMISLLNEKSRSKKQIGIKLSELALRFLDLLNEKENGKSKEKLEH